MKFSIRRKQETVDAMFSAVGFTARGAMVAIRNMLKNEPEVSGGWYWRKKHTGMGKEFVTVYLCVIYK